jgi:peptidoglycan/LPS O-acetylase OafA/YrhL
MIGILVFYWTGEQERRQKELDRDGPSMLSLQQKLTNENLRRNEARLNVLLCLIGSISLMLMKEAWLGVWLARLLCTAMAGFIIWSGAKYPSPLMTNSISRWIGDHSYTVSIRGLLLDKLGFGNLVAF